MGKKLNVPIFPISCKSKKKEFSVTATSMIHAANQLLYTDWIAVVHHVLPLLLTSTATLKVARAIEVLVSG